MEAIQPAKETTAVDLGALLDASDDAMVTLVAGDTRLVAHRAVLMERSPVFSDMFRLDTKEASCGQVTIADVEGPVLRQLLSFLYTLRVPQLPDMAAQLLEAADKYGVAGLEAACEQQVVAQLSVETAAAAAALAVRHSCTDLRKAAINFIKANEQVMATKGWAEAVFNHPKDVVEVSRLLAERRAVTSAPAPAASGSSASPRTATQLDNRRKRHCQTPPIAVLAKAVSRPAPLPDEAAVSRWRSLPARERNRGLIKAAEKGAVGELEVLLAAGADVAATDWECLRRTALHYAAEGGHVAASKWLVARRAPVDARDDGQSTPLHLAAHHSHAAVVRLLLAASADHSVRDCLGWTPLHGAAFRGHREAVAALVEAGADRGAKNNRGQTPLDLARMANHQQLVELLAKR